LPSVREFILWLKDSANFEQSRGYQYFVRNKNETEHPFDFLMVNYHKGTLSVIEPPKWSKLPYEQQGYRYTLGRGNPLIFVVQNYDRECDIISRIAIAETEPTAIARVAYIDVLKRI
jgi:hypothetical protein